MASLLRAIHECIFGVDQHLVNSSREENIIAGDVLRTLFSAHQGGKLLEKSMQDIIGDRGWTENIAKAILGGVENGLRQGIKMGGAMAEAFEKAFSEASGFAHDHPFFCALIAVGILAILMPWLLEALGFAELGPLEGTFAAWWQSTYRGYVTKDSLFSFFQRLGLSSSFSFKQLMEMAHGLEYVPTISAAADGAFVP
ncbi:hypothetical protein V491_03339 [Pseudogymnoascus sp. VKM F-3775]|nr:hypothetical protein V491_03339 [Pseudogymnoascus sp. VKM F-3775]